MFAKIFESEKYGQILVKIDSDDNHDPEVRVYVEPPELGVCSVALSVKNEDEDVAWSKAEELFQKLEIDEAEKMASRVFELI